MLNPFSNTMSNPSILVRPNNAFPVCNNHQFLNHLHHVQQARNLSQYPVHITQQPMAQNVQLSPTVNNQISPRSVNLQTFLNNQNMALKSSQNPFLQSAPSQLNGNFSSPRNNPELSNQFNTMLLTWKFQNNLQAEFYKNQVLQLVEMQKDLNSKLAAVQNLPHKASPEHYNRSPETSIKFKQEDDEPILQPVNRKTLRNQIRGIIQFVLPNYGRISEAQMEHEKERYEDPDLRAVFDALIAKYSSTIKTKEEMIKYTLRKAFKYIKKGVKKEMKLDSKEASNILCNKYFKESTTKLPDFRDEEDFLKFLLPFRKCSKNKTMNSSFIHEVFSSEEFQRDYQTYLEDLDEILEADNNGKIERFVYFIEECIKKKKIQDIKKYKRIPWPELWVANTKKIAIELPGVKIATTPGSNNNNKRIKKEYSKLMISPHGSDTSGSENERTISPTSKLAI